MTSIALENAAFSQAREANRLKDEFLATVSHELRTPLNALRSWAWVLAQGAVSPEKIGSVAEAIERSVAAQTRLVDDLLAGRTHQTTLASTRSTVEFVSGVYASALLGTAILRAELVPGHPFYADLTGGMAADDITARMS